MALYGDDPTDPKKKTKTTTTVTTGEPTTTVSTRRGEIRKGIPGTFTDTKVDTPVTTTTNTENSGSVPFQEAFAKARKEGLPSFTFGDNSYNTNLADSKTDTKSSTTSTFKRDKVKGVPQLNPSGIKFVPQKYKMGKTQNIQNPGQGMGAYSVSRGDGRDASIGKLKTQDAMVLNKNQGANLINAGDRINQQLDSRFGEERIRKKFAGRPQEFIDKQVAKGAVRIANNKVTVKKAK